MCAGSHHLVIARVPARGEHTITDASNEQHLTNFHETYREHDVAKASSSRTFGFVMAAFFLLLAFRFRSRAGSLWVSLISIALTLIVIALTRPAVLAPFNRAWMALGKLLNRVVSPVVLALLFFGVVWPIGFLMRLTGNDALRLKRAAATGSYWVAREPLESDHFTRQF
jgi:hypothetical protein